MIDIQSVEYIRDTLADIREGLTPDDVRVEKSICILTDLAIEMDKPCHWCDRDILVQEQTFNLAGREINRTLDYHFCPMCGRKIR